MGGSERCGSGIWFVRREACVAINERFAEGGLAALGQPRGYPKGRAHGDFPATNWFDPSLKTEGDSNREIARQFGCQ